MELLEQLERVVQSTHLLRDRDTVRHNADEERERETMPAVEIRRELDTRLGARI